MASFEPEWQRLPDVHPPTWVLEMVQRLLPERSGQFVAQLLWQRGMHEPEQLRAFLDVEQYQPTSAFAFGDEMERAIATLQEARDRNQKLAIWGDFDADGVTATAVLWEGLGQFFPQQDALTYHIPNRLIESHGLSERGVRELAAAGVQLIVTCDTGSTNLTELELAQRLGLTVVITDHHTLPAQRPPVAAILNPRYLATDHPLAHLSGVAVAYKLIEALYHTWPQVPQQPVEQLLDLVAIGLIADLVQLTGDCRYLAQRGIQHLQRQLKVRSRPGVAQLLELCKRTGDRPTDISFGIGPRINAVSRIQGDASFCVELLTSRDAERCRILAAETELANSRRKALQASILQQVESQLAQLDLSTTEVIVLSNDQWPVGVLGLVAGQVAQTYGRPTILLSTDSMVATNGPMLARGSARSVRDIDLYRLVKGQAHLLHRFGGHPFAAGLSLPIENIPLFTEAINHQLRQQGLGNLAPIVQVDLEVTVADLVIQEGQSLFRELKLLEPCGMGNPTPKLLIRDCQFEQVWHRNIKDRSGQKLKYVKAEFEVGDATTDQRFPGHWWGHYKEDIPQGRCDAVVELDFNAYVRRYEVRLVAVRLAQEPIVPSQPQAETVLDWRQACPVGRGEVAIATQCPRSWSELNAQLQPTHQLGQSVALSYEASDTTVQDYWRRWVGIAKYLARTQQWVTQGQLQDKMNVSATTVCLGLTALESLGFQIQQEAGQISMHGPMIKPTGEPLDQTPIVLFLQAIQEEQFQQQYFQVVSLETLQRSRCQTL